MVQGGAASTQTATLSCTHGCTGMVVWTAALTTAQAQTSFDIANAEIRTMRGLKQPQQIFFAKPVNAVLLPELLDKA